MSMAETLVDLHRPEPFTQQQLTRRWRREIVRAWSENARLPYLEFLELGRTLTDPGAVIPDYDTMKAYFQDLSEKAVAREADDRVFNDLLSRAVAYEQAVKDKARLTLKINGREEQEEQEEIRDDETGEVIQEYQPYLAPIEPIPETVTVTHEDGTTEEVKNPRLIEAEEALAAAQSVIDNTAQDVLDLVEERAA